MLFSKNVVNVESHHVYDMTLLVPWHGHTGICAIDIAKRAARAGVKITDYRAAGQGVQQVIGEGSGEGIIHVVHQQNPCMH